MDNRPQANASLSGITANMQKKGMSTRDIVVALCAAKASVKQLTHLTDVIITDVHAAQLKAKLQTITNDLEKQTTKLTQAIQTNIELIGGNKTITQLRDGYNHQYLPLAQQADALIQERVNTQEKCDVLIKQLQSEIQTFTQTESQTTNKAEFLKKIQPIAAQLLGLDKAINNLLTANLGLAKAAEALKKRTDITLINGGITPTPASLRPE